MTGKKLRKESKQILLEICIGILLYMLVGECIIFFLPQDTAPVAIGFFLGCLLSAGSMTHITYVTELTMDMHNQKAAEKYVTGRYFIRVGIWAVVLVVACFTEYLNMLAVFIGGFGIKVGAYLQPFIHHFLEWFLNGNKNKTKREGGE